MNGVHFSIYIFLDSYCFVAGTNKTSYIKLIRHAITTLGYHYEDIYHPQIKKSGNMIDSDQNPSNSSEVSITATKMTKASFMTEVCTELAITKNLATTDTFMCHDEGDVILTTFGFYSPSDLKHAGGVNLICSGLDGLVNYSRTTGRQSINVQNATLSMREFFEIFLLHDGYLLIISPCEILFVFSFGYNWEQNVKHLASNAPEKRKCWCTRSIKFLAFTNDY
jgi:hypothetical protein